MTKIRDIIDWRRQMVAEAWESYTQLRVTHQLPPEFEDLMRQLRWVASDSIDDAELLREMQLERKLSDRKKAPGQEKAIYAAMAKTLILQFNINWIDYMDPNLPRGFWEPVLDELAQCDVAITRQALTKFMHFRSDRWKKVNNAIAEHWRMKWKAEAIESLQES